MVDYEISKEFSNFLYEKTKLEEKINVLNSVLKQLSLIGEKDLYKQTLNIKSKLVDKLLDIENDKPSIYEERY